jgi:hypothetical protein
MDTTEKKNHYPPTPGLGPNSVRKANADRILANINKINRQSENLSPKGKIAKPDSDTMVVSPRKGMPKREITKDNVISVMHLQQDLAAERLRISVSVLKKACKKFKFSKWPRKYPEALLGSPPVIKDRKTGEMSLTDELGRSA